MLKLNLIALQLRPGCSFQMGDTWFLIDRVYGQGNQVHVGARQVTLTGVTGDPMTMTLIDTTPIAVYIQI